MTKMTKETAIKMLLNKKVKVNNETTKKVQEKLFALGFRWAYTYDNIQISKVNAPYLFIHNDMQITQSYYETSFKEDIKKEITAEEIINLKIIEDYVPKFGDIVRVNLNSSCFIRDYRICIMPNKTLPEQGIDDNFFDIANINRNGNLGFSPCGYCKERYTIFPASESEKQELFDNLANVGKKWNAEKKCLENIIPNEDLDLTKILKNCPKGTKLYSVILGDVFFEEIDNCNDKYPIWLKDSNNEDFSITKKGYLYAEYNNVECTLFPSKNQRDWNKWKCPKPELPIDTPVMVSNNNRWELRYYAGGKFVWMDGYKSKDKGGMTEWLHTIPFDKFDPNNIEESLKYDICKED